MKWPIFLFLLICLLNPVFAKEQKVVDVLYLKIQQPERPTLSNLDPIPEDLGLKGAELGVADNNTTGGFLGYQFQLDVQEFEAGDLQSAKSAINKSDANYVSVNAEIW